MMATAAVQLSVPAFVEPDQRRSAWAFTKLTRLPYRPRQVLDSGHVAKVISFADARERRGLPRYGVRSPIRHDPIPEGTYNEIGASWFTREHFLTVVLPMVLAENPEALKGMCSVDTFLRWARVESAFAQHQHSGRDIIVRPSTVAELMACVKRTVQRCRAVGRLLGVYVDVFEGRMLTEPERRTAQHEHASPQRGLSNVSCMVIPTAYAGRVLPQAQPRPVDCVTPSRGGNSLDKLPTLTLIPGGKTGSAQTVKRAASPRASTERSRIVRSVKPRPGLALAESLIERVGWLSGCPGRRIEGLIRPFAIQTDPWTAQDLVDEIDQIDARLGHTAPQTPRTAPWGLLRYYLNQINHETALASQRRNRSRPWCGECESADYRWVEVGPDRLPHRCPTCGVAPQRVGGW